MDRYTVFTKEAFAGIEGKVVDVVYENEDGTKTVLGKGTINLEETGLMLTARLDADPETAMRSVLVPNSQIKDA